MNSLRTLRTLALVSVVWLGFLGGPIVVARDYKVQTSVFSKISPEYKRTVLPNGSFRKELYALSDGGLAEGTTRDETVDRVPFPTIAGIVAENLGRQNYFLAPDSKSAQLLLVVEWGRTIPHNGINYTSGVNGLSSAMSRSKVISESLAFNPGAPLTEEQKLDITQSNDALEGAMLFVQMQNSVRDRLNEKNARLLGYADELNKADGIARYAGGGDRFNDLLSDIEEPRYYVVVRAYDFRRAVEKSDAKLLWVTRISVRTSDNTFDDSLRDMLTRASGYFGRDSGKLVQMHEGRVKLGEAEVIGVAQEGDSATKPGNVDRAGRKN